MSANSKQIQPKAGHAPVELAGSVGRGMPLGEDADELEARATPAALAGLTWVEVSDWIMGEVDVSVRGLVGAARLACDC